MCTDLCRVPALRIYTLLLYTNHSWNNSDWSKPSSGQYHFKRAAWITWNILAVWRKPKHHNGVILVGNHNKQNNTLSCCLCFVKGGIQLLDQWSLIQSDLCQNPVHQLCPNSPRPQLVSAQRHKRRAVLGGGWECGPSEGVPKALALHATVTSAFDMWGPEPIYPLPDSSAAADRER